MFKIEFETENSAFEDPHDAGEIGEILKKITGDVFDGYTGGVIRCSNGGKIGSWNYDKRD
jgi:energy-converting hydrogenase Eha subunit B